MAVKVETFLNNLNKALTANTFYLQGGFGQRLWVPDWYNKEYDWNTRNAYLINLHSAKKEHCFGFDCVCLIKSALWGFDADINKEYGGAVYKSNDVPDCTTKAMAESCSDLTTRWDIELDPGEIVVYDAKASHVGVYIGNGAVIESTTAWDCKVQKTLLPGIANPNKLPVRQWYSHGHTTFVDYKDTFENAFNKLSEKYGELEASLEEMKMKLANSENQRLMLAASNSIMKQQMQKVKEIVDTWKT